MSKKILTSLIAFLGLLLVLGSPKSAVCGNADDTEGVINGIIGYELEKYGEESAETWISKELTENAGISSEWWIFGLSQYSDKADFSDYIDALSKYVSENETRSAVQKQKYALIFTELGVKNAFAEDTVQTTIGKQGIMSLVFGLHLLNNGLEAADFTPDTLAEQIISLAKADGGWSVMGDYSDADVTAMTIQALAALYGQNAAVQEAVDRGLALLSERQLEDGAFSSSGTENAESTAQVLLALTMLGIDPDSDARFIKNGNTLMDALMNFRLSDGSFSHTLSGETNESATVQVFYSLVSLWKVRNGGSGIYLFAEKSEPEVTGTPEITPAVEITVTPETIAEPALTAAAEPTAAPVVTDSAVQTVTPAITDWTDITASPAVTGHETEDATEGSGVSKTNGESGNGRLYAIAIIAAIAALACVVLAVLKKFNLKNFIFILLLAAVAVLLTFLIKISSVSDYYGGSEEQTEVSGHVTLCIRCDTVAGESDTDYIPENGVILDTSEFAIEDGDTVYDVLIKAAKAYEISVESTGVTASSEKLAYISGIAGLYELDFGDLSGWVYHVNGVAPNVGCGAYSLKDGDVIEWLYTKNLGEDVQ